MTGVAVATAVAGGLLGATEAASATPTGSSATVPATVTDPCGYLSWGSYRHCDGGTGSTVMLDVQDVWGNIYHYCVGPGVTNLQAPIRWRVTGAWWNGGVGCSPGFYG
ncbi:DUF6355 family natural product biosynthesis protein [Amycolatopsis sp. NPDC059021]|uniref:DUF6355 family natural product biosynthesis protein n=1 Tax=Amycolatopsis sp. NPDC059021 TaxID=3346704 RepID=UPI00366A9C72